MKRLAQVSVLATNIRHACSQFGVNESAGHGDHAAYGPNARMSSGVCTCNATT